MTTTPEVVTSIIVALLVLVGCCGIIIPVLPGSVLILASVLVWAFVVNTTSGWIVFVIVAVCTLAGMASSWLITGRRLKVRGVPNRSLLAGLVVGIVGFFVIPVLGLLIGFAVGLYLAEWARLRDPKLAWQTSWAAIRAAGLGIAIEFSCAAVTGGAYGVGLWLHFH